jgi:hypothetical protein
LNRLFPFRGRGRSAACHVLCTFRFSVLVVVCYGRGGHLRPTRPCGGSDSPTGRRMDFAWHHLPPSLGVPSPSPKYPRALMDEWRWGRGRAPRLPNGNTSRVGFTATKPPTALGGYSVLVPPPAGGVDGRGAAVALKNLPTVGLVSTMRRFCQPSWFGCGFSVAPINVRSCGERGGG